MLKLVRFLLISIIILRNLQTRNDAGFTKIMEWAQSCVKGVRTSDHKCIELRVAFFQTRIEPQWIPF